MYIGAIADDLTGATDLSLTFSREGMRVLQVVGVPTTPNFGDADVVVVSLKSRTIAAAEAVSQSLAAARALLAGGAQQLFFKYCSTCSAKPTPLPARPFRPTGARCSRGICLWAMCCFQRAAWRTIP